MKIKIFVFNPIQENTYLLYDETKEAVIIDCGASNPTEHKELVEYIESNDLKLKYLLNTHLHFDHMLGNQFIYEKYGLKPTYNELEEQLPGIKSQAEGFGLPLNCKPVHADTFLNDGEFVRFGNTSLQALLTPGHSPGSLSFYSEKDKCVFTGDALFYRSIGRTDLWGGNMDILINGIKTKLLTLPNETVVYPGHGPASTIKDEKENNPYLA